MLKVLADATVWGTTALFSAACKVSAIRNSSIDLEEVAKIEAACVGILLPTVNALPKTTTVKKIDPITEVRSCENEECSTKWQFQAAFLSANQRYSCRHGSNSDRICTV